MLISVGDNMSIPMESKIVRIISGNEHLPAIFERGKTYIIPEYQREYSWGEEQIDSFMTSVKRCLDGDDIFMGTVQFAYDSGKENEFHVIDGQQRMTTFLLFCHVMDALVGSDIVGQNGMALEVRNFAINAEKLSQALALDYDSIPCVSGNKKVRAEFERTKSNYEKNLSYIKEEIEEVLSGSQDRQKDAQKLFRAVLDKMYFVALTTTDIPLPQVVGIFNTINTTGLDLNCSDLFKLQYYEFLKRNYPECDDWMRLISACYEKANEHGIHMKDLLDVYKHCIVARYDLRFEMLSKGHEAFFEEIFSFSKGKIAAIDPKAAILRFEEFERLLDITIELNRHLESGDSALAKIVQKDELFAMELLWMTRYSRYWTLPYVAAYFKCEKTDSAELRLDKLALSLRAALAVAKYLIVCSVNFDKVINPVQTYICGTILPLLAKGDLGQTSIEEEIQRRIKDSPYDWWKDAKNWNAEEFRYRIGNDLFYNGTRSYIVCTLSALLDELEAGVSVEDISSKLFDRDNFQYDMEHIYARNRFVQEDEENLQIYNSIGNLVALDRSINRSVQDKETREKIEQYVESRLVAVKKVVEQVCSTPDKEWNLPQIRARLQEQEKRLCGYLGL